VFVVLEGLLSCRAWDIIVRMESVGRWGIFVVERGCMMGEGDIALVDEDMLGFEMVVLGYETVGLKMLKGLVRQGGMKECRGDMVVEEILFQESAEGEMRLLDGIHDMVVHVQRLFHVHPLNFPLSSYPFPWPYSRSQHL
jgi:hypothetical protein